MTSESVLSIFKEITTIPRESGHEEKIIAYLLDFASEHGLQAKRDKAGNVLIVKEADPGMENIPTIVLQSHQDMVCEKKAGVEHDFAKDPIHYIIEGGWMIAPDTTLGADCGIGIAAELALITGGMKTGRIECLFTVSEETGLDGAIALEPDFITGKTLINLDSEDEGEIFVGCAGGLDTTAKFTYKEEPVAEGSVGCTFYISGGIGGHSGDDINKGRANAVQLLGSFLYSILGKGWQLVKIDGGNKRNAIARDASAELAVTKEFAKELPALADEFFKNVKEEYGNIEKDIEIGVKISDRMQQTAIDSAVCRSLVTSLCCCPHGVLAMSQEIPGFVETSTNLASVKMTEPGVIRIGSSQRSCITAARRAAGLKVEACFAQAGADVRHESEYPGWAPVAVSAIRDASVASYKKLFGVEPKVKAIHAGLECGLFTEKWPDLDMVSFGPTLRNVHTPGEKLDLASLDKFIILLKDIIENFK